MPHLAGYLGQPILLADLLFTSVDAPGVAERKDEAPHHEIEEEDGFSIGWMHHGKSAQYREAKAITRDSNLRNIANMMRLDRCSILTGGQQLQTDDLLFLVDGYVENFDQTLKPAALEYASNEIIAQMQTLDLSSCLLAMLQQRQEEPDHIGLEPALQEILSTLEVSLRDLSACLNLVVLTDDRLIAARQSINHNSSPLFYAVNSRQFPHASLVSSARFGEATQWCEIPDHHLFTTDANGNFDLLRL